MNTPEERRSKMYGIGFNRGYLLGLEHGLAHPDPTCERIAGQLRHRAKKDEVGG